MIEKLPNWCMTKARQAIYDHESGSAIEMTGRVYAKIQELIDDYNGFVSTCSGMIENFISTSNKDYETFQVAMRQEFQDFINVIELKYNSLDIDLTTLKAELQQMQEDIITAVETATNTVNRLVETAETDINEKVTNANAEIEEAKAEALEELTTSEVVKDKANTYMHTALNIKEADFKAPATAEEMYTYRFNFPTPVSGIKVITNAGFTSAWLHCDGVNSAFIAKAGESEYYPVEISGGECILTVSDPSGLDMVIEFRIDVEDCYKAIQNINSKVDGEEVQLFNLNGAMLVPIIPNTPGVYYEFTATHATEELTIKSNVPCGHSFDLFVNGSKVGSGELNESTDYKASIPATIKKGDVVRISFTQFVYTETDKEVNCSVSCKVNESTTGGSSGPSKQYISVRAYNAIPEGAPKLKFYTCDLYDDLNELSINYMSWHNSADVGGPGWVVLPDNKMYDDNGNVICEECYVGDEPISDYWVEGNEISFGIGVSPTDEWKAHFILKEE